MNSAKASNIGEAGNALVLSKGTTNLCDFATTSFTDENQSLVILQNLQELLFLVPNGEGLPLLQNLIVPLRVRPPVPSIDQTVTDAVDGTAVGFDNLGGGGVHHIE